jgi:hypothetical protein
MMAQLSGGRGKGVELGYLVTAVACQKTSHASFDTKANMKRWRVLVPRSERWTAREMEGPGKLAGQPTAFEALGL